MLQALLCDELEKARQQKEQAKKDVRAATRAEKNAMKRRNRLLKATLQGHCAALPLWRWQAAKGLSGEDLKLLLAAKEATAVLQCVLMQAVAAGSAKSGVRAKDT